MRLLVRICDGRIYRPIDVRQGAALREEFEIRSQAELETQREPVSVALHGEGRRVSVPVLVVWTQPYETLRN